ncbi:MAG: universal stress protein [Planctomycetota bacterium]|jgi:nucleotide-binding universal stress UspA family protein
MTTDASAPARFRRILATTDASEFAAVAVRQAIEIAAAHGASIDLLHVAIEELQRLEPRVYARETDEAIAPLEAMAAERGVAMTRHVMPGRASTVISEQVAALSPDLVVLGARGRTVFDRLLLGSVTDRVIRRTDRPVLVVHPADTRPLIDVRTVVAAVDFSGCSEAVVAAARRMLAARGGPGTLLLVHADAFAADPMVAATAAESGGEAAARAAELRERIDAITEAVREPGLAVEAIVSPAYPVELLDREVRRADADLIVVGRSGRGRLERLLLGSVAQRVLEHASCPVLVAGP